ncbi:MAG: glycosyltransferase [Coriobacteriia bacterium]|nr:glycosyltransferase [Coriobacteriia bacterium]
MSDDTASRLEGEKVARGLIANEYVLSVVIPTRNRVSYALGAIEQILSIDDPGLQLVIQDNGDDDSLRAACDLYLENPRFVYSHSRGTLSFVDNFTKAVGLASGEYVTIIGDDDGINPEILDVVRWARANSVSAIKPGLQAMYFWPDVGLDVTEDAGDSGVLLINPITSDVALKQTQAELDKLMRDGCQEYLQRDLVKVYHGIVRGDVLEEVQRVAGHYFGGLSPDIYAAIALSAVADDVVCIDYPLTIPGVCRTSGSADSASGRHTGRIEDAPHFVGHESYEWAPEVPEFYSVETIWADSGLAAAREMRRADLVDLFRIEYLSAFCMLRHPEYRSLVREHYFAWQRAHGRSRLQALAGLLSAQIEIPLRRALNSVCWRLTRRPRGLFQVNGVKDISAASCELTRYLASSGLDVATCISRLEESLKSPGAAR